MEVFVIKHSFEGSANKTEPISPACQQLEIVNDGAPIAVRNTIADGADDLTFTIGANTIRVKRGERYIGVFDDFEQVIVTALYPYRAITSKLMLIKVK